jgi:hypothetical protein
MYCTVYAEIETVKVTLMKTLPKKYKIFCNFNFFPFKLDEDNNSSNFHFRF